ncbi:MULTISPECIES: hypothetical protein [Lactobacillaceae]|uniref:hypothetical protein n=1 Tax=Lactobacillaceae TaxID=33958 RepID=UPI0014568A8C|nr:hypothetical protein [Lactobacillus sp. HBUAS51381]NLR08688.1 hypothetical protein [Lactobacillus sp. HBUAS51381]
MKIVDERFSSTGMSSYGVGQVICTDGTPYLIVGSVTGEKCFMVDLEESEIVAHADSLSELFKNVHDEGDQLVDAKLTINGK